MEHLNNTTNSIGHKAHLVIKQSWDGKIAKSSERISVIFRVNDQQLDIQIEAPFHGDPTPPAPAGEFEGLWNYEVVELFLLGSNGHYLEIELGLHRIGFIDCCAHDNPLRSIKTLQHPTP